MRQGFVFWGAVNGFLAVALGAFGAHGLDGHITPRLLAAFKTGTEYQLTHALALILVGLLSAQWGSRSVQTAGRLFLLGIVLFSGSLYALALSGITVLGAITPLGGLSFLAGWLLLARAAVAAEKPAHL